MLYKRFIFVLFTVFLFSFSYCIDVLAVKLSSKEQNELLFQKENISKAKKFEEILYILRFPADKREKLFKQQSYKSFPFLKEIAFNDKYGVDAQWNALMSIVQIKKKGSYPYIKRAATSNSWYLRNASFIALGQISNEKALKLAKKLLNDPAMVVRAAAVNFIKEQKDISSRFLLWKTLWDKKNYHKGESLWIRKSIVKALYALRQNNDQDREKWIRVLKDEDKSLHSFAKKTLAKK